MDVAGSPEERSMPQVSVFNSSGQLIGPVESPAVRLSDAEWKSRLSPEQYRILRNQGTERAFCGTLLDNKQDGVYSCAGCGLPLFASTHKFNSGTGWPSFFQPIAESNVLEHVDNSHGMRRVEIACARCEGHFGHVRRRPPADGAAALPQFRIAPVHPRFAALGARRPGSRRRSGSPDRAAATKAGGTLRQLVVAGLLLVHRGGVRAAQEA